MNTWSRIGSLSLVLALTFVTFAEPADATIQDESCWAPDIEYPVPCDDDED